MDNQKMVERFEEAFLDGKSLDNPLVSSQLHRGADGLYFNFNTRVMFNWFVKGAASVVVELPEPPTWSRTSACLSACEGIHDDTLRQVAGKGLFTKAVEAINQHSELLEALELAVEALKHSKPVMCHYPDAVERHQVAQAKSLAAIAKAKAVKS